MKKYYPLILAALYILLLCLFSDVGAQTPPWMLPYPNGRSVPVSNYVGLTAAISNAQSMDVITLADGDYTGDITIKKSDLMLKCPGHCILSGYILLDAPNIWLWGLEIKTFEYHNVNFFSANGGIINCVIHGNGAASQVGVFTAPVPLTPNNKMVFYGNIVYDEQYAVYAQNTKGSPKYFVNNYLSDVIYPSQPWIIHNYAQSPNKVQDIHYINNVISTGSILTGGQGDPATDGGTPPIEIEFKGNYLYKTATQGFKRPFNLQFIDNFFIKSPMSNDFIWGVGEGWFSYPATPFTVTGNKFYNPGQQQIYYRSSRYPAFNQPREDGIAPFRLPDVIGPNEYYGGFSAGMFANNVNVSTGDINQWRTMTEAAGNRFDANSTVSANPPADGYAFNLNEYDPSRGLLSVWKFSGPGNIPITLPKPAEIRSVRDSFGSPVVSCNSYPCNVPTAEFDAYLVILKAGPTCDLSIVQQKLDEALMLLNQKKYTKCRAALNAARILLDEYKQQCL